VINGADSLTLMPGLREPKPYFSPDPAQNRRSAKKLAPLEPKLVVFGHGPPCRDPRRFVDFVNGLPD
jgi:hydroxyacylglutathione hydrolase